MRRALGDWEQDTATAQALAREGRLVAARQRVLPVVREAPDFVPALEVLARVDWYAADYPATRFTLRRLMRLNPHEPGYRLLDALAAIHMGDLAGAARSLDLAEAKATDASFLRQVQDSRQALEVQCAQAIRAWRDHHRGFDEWFLHQPEAAAEWLGVPVSVSVETPTAMAQAFLRRWQPPSGLATRRN